MNLIEKAQAQATNETDWNVLRPDPVGAAIWQNVLSNAIDIILIIAGALAVIYLIYSGILYITAAGNPDSAKKGQQGIINAVIGIVIIIAAYFLVRVAVNLAGTLTA